VGAVPDPAIGRYAGEGRSGPGVLRAPGGVFRPGDVVLAGRLLCARTEVVTPEPRGIDPACRLTSHRAADFRRGRRPGAGGHVAGRPKPNEPRSIDRAAYDALPDSPAVRETRARVEQPGFRARALAAAATLADAETVTAGDPAQLHRERRNAELDLRALGRAVRMGVLRRKAPDLVREEVRADVPAYNLVRTVMARAATRRGVGPRSVGFEGAAQALLAFRPVIAALGDRDPARCRAAYDRVLAAVAAHRAGDRPDRFEPRRRKRRPEHHAFLRQPRAEVKRRMLKRFRRK
jgi:hypothetical protein